MEKIALLTLSLLLTVAAIQPALGAETPITILRLIHDRDKTNGFDLDGDGVVTEIDFFLLSVGWDPTNPGVFAPAPTIDSFSEMTSSETILITGTGQPFTYVEFINGLESTRASVNGDGVFAAEISLNPNTINRIFISSVDYTGQKGRANPIEVIQDSQPPEVHIDFPANNSELTNEAVTIAGRVGDRLTGFMGLNVSVNGAPAQVAIGIGPNGTFERSGVPLEMGENVIQVVGTDALGNTAMKEIALNRVPMTGPRMMQASGDGQSAMVHMELPQPIVIKMTEEDGVTPFPNKIVNFKVIRSDGRLAASPGLPSGSRSLMLQVRTDAQGMAQAYWMLGGDAGCGNNRIEVSSNSISGTIFFCASGNPAPPSQINIGSGDNQRTETGGSPPEPLVAWVNDSCNGVADNPVTFTVVQGDGLVNGATQVTVNTSQTGHAKVVFRAGTFPGNQVVKADFSGNPMGPAAFTLFAVDRIENSPTLFTGLIYDNAYCPLGNATCFLQVAGDFFTTQSNDDGEFSFQDLPDGPGYLHVNASTIDSRNGSPLPPGITYPDLSYETVVISNALNSLPTPVLLPPLAATNTVSFDNSEDVVLTIKGIEGLEMTVEAGSMRLRDGSVPNPSNPAMLSLNQVHHDDVPMPMPDGVAPPIAWTLQPSGATFDPPIEISYPNMTGLPAGAIAYFLSFDHDTGQFEIVASGSVTEDGSSIVSDPDAGIFEAGWGCNCPPYSVTGVCRNCLDVAVAFLDGRPVCPEAFSGLCPEDWTSSSFSAPLGSIARSARALNPRRVAARVFPANNSAENQLRLVEQWLNNLRDDGGSSPVGQICAQSTVILVGHSLGGDTVRLAGEIGADVRIVADPVSRSSLETFPGVPFYQRNLSFPAVGESSIVSFLSEDTLNPAEVQNCSNIGTANFGDIECVRGYRVSGAEETTVTGTDHGSIIDSPEFRIRVLQSVQDALDGSLKGPGELLLDGSFMFIVNGQRYQVEDDGSYVIQNITAPDEFGVQGPGSPPDFVADDDIQVVGVGKQGTNRVFVLSEAFRVILDGTVIIDELEMLNEPPPLPELLTLDTENAVISPEETTQFSLEGLFFDGSMRDLTSTDTGTTYRVSNLDVIGVDNEGLVAGIGNGIAFLTATNFGVTSVKRLTIASQTISTTIEGRLVDPSGSPLEGADVTTTAFGGTAISDVDGFFSFEVQLPGTTQFVTVVVTAGEEEFSSDLLPVIVDGITDAGILAPGPASFMTTVEGTVEFEGGAPVENAVVFSNFGGQALTGVDGSFSFEVTAELGKGLPTLNVTARLESEGMTFAGTVTGLPVVAGGVTDAGTITLRMVSENAFPGRRHQLATNVQRFVVEDIDTDGNPDFASVGLDGEVRVDFNLGGGTFGEPVVLSTGGFTRDVVAADVNGDTFIDLIVAYSEQDSVSIYLGNGDRTFQEPKLFAAGDDPSSVAVGNLNGDSVPDLAVGVIATSEVILLSGVGDGTFEPLGTLSLGGFFNTVRVAIQDITGDSNADIVASHSSNSNVTVFTGDGEGNFTDMGANATGVSTTGVIVGNLNGDSIPDLVTSAGQSNGEVSVLIGNGDGTFQERSITNVGMELSDITSADFDADGNLDVAVVDRKDNETGVYVLNGNGDGTFQEPIFLSISRSSNTLEAADLDGNGSVDLLASVAASFGGEVIVFQNDGTGVFGAQKRLSASGTGVRGLELVDVTGDAIPDLVSTIFLSHEVAVFPASGGGMYDSPILSPTIARPENLAVADFNNDTVIDVATVHRNAPGTRQWSLGISLGNGDGTFADAAETKVNATPSRLTTGDIDRDGASDIILPGTTSAVLLLFGIGDGTFIGPIPQPAPSTSRDAELADLNGDDNLDLIVVPATNNIHVLLGNGDGSFQSAQTYTVKQGPENVLITELNGDTIPDLVVGHFQSGEVSSLIGNGDGTFQQQISVDLSIYGGVGEKAELLRAADVNGDSLTDVVFAFVFNTIGVLYGDGTGFLGGFERYDAGNVPVGLVVEDVNDDSFPDVITTNNNGSDISILLHN